MKEFTKEEISLCKQVAEKHRKTIKYGDWYHIRESGRNCVYAPEGIYLSEDAIKYKTIFSLWTISDCLEFLRERCKDHVLLIHEENLDDDEEWYLWFDEFHETQQWGKGKTPLEACLKAVLAVLEEKAK